MTMPKDWKSDKKDSNDDGDDYLYNSRNSVDNYSIDSDVNRSVEPKSFNTSKPSYKNNKPLSYETKISLGIGICMFIFWISIGFLLKAFSDWFYWFAFLLFVIVLPISTYGKFTTKSRKRRR